MSDESSAWPGASRRLHGVLLADMTGFSRLMGEDESRAVDALNRIRDIFTSVVPRHGGTLDVSVGDCFVALFDSAVEAVRAAVAIQTELAGVAGSASLPVQIRIGIHVGDVMRSGNEILGDSINIAARLQTIARPGGIAVSEDVYRGVRNRVPLPFRDLGPKSLKNIREKIRVYELVVGDRDADGDGAPNRRPMRNAALTVVAVAVAAIVGFLGYRWTQQQPAVAVRAATHALKEAAAPAPAAVDGDLTVGVTGVSAHGAVPSWMRDSTRDGFNTLFSKVAGLRVFSREKIDFLRERRGLSEIEVAETLGIQKMISGSMTADGDVVVIEARVVDTSSGILDASESARGNAEDLIELQNRVASDVLGALGVELTADDRAELFARRTKETLEGYRRMAETFGEAPDDAKAPPEASERRSWLSWPGAVALAQEPDPAEEPIRAVLEAYRLALEGKDVDGVAATHVDLTAEQRSGFERYFESADGLRVVVSDVDILVVGDEALLTFTRRDGFNDRISGKEVELEVRLSSEVVSTNGNWRMRGVKRSSD